MTVFKHGDPVRMWAHTLTPHTTGTVTGTTPEGRVLVRWDDNHAITEQVPHYLTPLGEPMSTAPDFFAEPGSHNPEPKTFNSVLGHGRTIEAERISGYLNLVIRKGPSRPDSHLGISLATEDAPALALAILETAGIEACAVAAYNPGTDIYLSSIAGALTEHTKAIEAKAKADTDREALEGEALALFNSTRPDHRQIGEWGNAYPMNKKRYTEVALKARELYGVKA